METARAGWYPHPTAPGTWGYWDGRTWHGAYEAAAAGAPPPPSTPPGAHGTGGPGGSGWVPPPQFGAYGPGGPQVPMGGYPQNNGYAIASLVLGLFWMWGVGSVLALVFGYKAKSEIDRSGGMQTGRGLAVAGIVLGWIGVAGVALLVVLGALLVSSMPGLSEIDSDPVDGYCDMDRYWQDPDC